jgi:SpoVK/Ycf46/Vps4 family AAA+-type ATPase
MAPGSGCSSVASTCLYRPDGIESFNKSDKMKRFMSDRDQLLRLLRAGHACVSILTYEESEALVAARGAANDLGRELLEWSVTRGLRDGLVAAAPVISDTEHPAAALYFLSTLERPTIAVMLDLIAHLKDERTLRTLRETIDVFTRNGSTLILIDQSTELPPALRALATPMQLSLPDEDALRRIVTETLRTCDAAGPIKIDITRADLATMIRDLRGLTARQARQIIRDAVCDDLRLDASDLSTVLAQKRRLMQGEGLLQYVQAPVDMDEIGGLRRMKFWLEQRGAALSEDATKFGIDAPRGILMLGVQGAGKSLAAKAVATAWKRPLLRMDVGALYDKFIGESERKLREALAQAERMAPIILWIDEIEKAFASAASQSADGGLSKRMFGALLTWMQERTAPVFVVATANDIDALPPELLRKGRFDEIFFVDLPDADARRMIFAIHLRKRKRDAKKFDLDRLSQSSEGFSGAEIEQAVLAALQSSFASQKEMTTDAIVEALANSPPLSVVMAERVASLRRWAEGRCVPAD